MTSLSQPASPGTKAAFTAAMVELQKENAELRAALERLADWPESTPEHRSIISQDVAMREFASAALGRRHD